MLTIRFARVGKKNRAQYKIMLQEKTAAPGGRHVEILGAHDPHLKKTVLKEDRIKFWLERGAQTSDTVHNLLVAKGVMAGEKRKVKMPAKKVAEAPAEVATGNSVAEAPKAEIKVEEAKPETVEKAKVETKVAATVEEKKIEEKKETEEAPKAEAK